MPFDLPPGNCAVTVIMSVYNGEVYLRESIESILDQSHRDFFFVIVDDGSEDNTSQILKGYKDQRIRLLRNGENIGLTRTLNKVIPSITTPYYVLQDADDISVRNRLERLISFMEENPGIIACGSNYRVIGQDQQTNFPIEHDDIRVSFFLGISALIHPAIFRTEVIHQQNIRYSERFRYAQDFKLWTDICRSFRVSNVNDILYLFRKHDHQVSETKSGAQRETVTRVCFEELDRFGIQPTEKESILHEKLISRKEFQSCKNIRMLRKWLKKLIKQNRLSSYFPEESFQRQVYRRGRYLKDSYFVQNYFASVKYNPILLFRFYSSACLPALNFSIGQQIRFIGKCLLFYSRKNAPS